MIASPMAGTEMGAEPSAAELEARYLLPVYKHLPIEPVRGEGVWLETRDGRRILDLYGGHAVALLGYGHPRLLAALAHQAGELQFQSNAVVQRVRGRAAEALVGFAPEGLEQAFFVNSAFFRSRSARPAPGRPRWCAESRPAGCAAFLRRRRDRSAPPGVCT